MMEQHQQKIILNLLLEPREQLYLDPMHMVVVQLLCQHLQAQMHLEPLHPVQEVMIEELYQLQLQLRDLEEPKRQ